MTDSGLGLLQRIFSQPSYLQCFIHFTAHAHIQKPHIPMTHFFLTLPYAANFSCGFDSCIFLTTIILVLMIASLLLFR